jgi:hypothetical protein
MLTFDIDLYVLAFSFQPQHRRHPSYMAVMLDMTDAADGFPFTPLPLLPFSHALSDLCTFTFRRSSLAC